MVLIFVFLQVFCNINSKTCKNAETTKIKNGNPHSPCLSPKEGNKKSVRESSNISNDIKFVNNPPESKINKQSPIVSHEKIFEKNSNFCCTFKVFVEV